MLASKTIWKYIPSDQTLSSETALKLSPMIRQLLAQRGIEHPDDVQQFMKPDLQGLHDPSLLSTIDKVKVRIQTAIDQQEKILIFGDYDADGVTSTTVMYKTLQELGAHCHFYIPNRFTEGYGLNENAIRQAAEEVYTVIITVDTGISAIWEASVAKAIGVDLIITDHHEVQEDMPDAFAIIHPKCADTYPFKELAGVGVAFKLAQYLLGYFPKHLLDLVAIGTIADLVPLVGENRILAYYGLQQLSRTDNKGIKALLKQCHVQGQVTEEDVGFLIGPRLNAVGRLQDADLAVQLLLTDDLIEATEFAEEVQSLNQERQKIVADIFKEAEQLVVNKREMPGVIIVAKEGWNQGVLGIVASRLVTKFERPAIVLSINEDGTHAKGSARSIPAFDLFENCMQIRDLFDAFGGHSQAAGMTISVENLREIEQRLDEQIHAQLTPEQFKQETEISGRIQLSEVNEAFIQEVEQLAPFGRGNPKPLFLLEHVPAEIRQLGNMKKHVKLQFREDSHAVEAIGFGMGELFYAISPRAKVSVVGELGINEWNGNKKPQILLKDIKVDSWQLFDQRGKRKLEPIYCTKKDKMVVIGETERNGSYPNAMYLADYTSEEASRADILVLNILPKQLSDLEVLLHKVQPSQIHICFMIEQSAYLQSFPNRTDFKQLYAWIYKQQKLHMEKELPAISRSGKWSLDNIQFMVDVFQDLGFIQVNNNFIQIQPTSEKKDLTTSAVYQRRKQKEELEKILYYSTFDELHQLLEKQMSYLESPKEEVIHGF